MKVFIGSLVVLNLLAVMVVTFLLVQHPQTLHRLAIDYKESK